MDKKLFLFIAAATLSGSAAFGYESDFLNNLGKTQEGRNIIAKALRDCGKAQKKDVNKKLICDDKKTLEDIIIQNLLAIGKFKVGAGKTEQLKHLFSRNKKESSNQEGIESENMSEKSDRIPSRFERFKSTLSRLKDSASAKVGRLGSFISEKIDPLKTSVKKKFQSARDGFSKLGTKISDSTFGKKMSEFSESAGKKFKNFRKDAGEKISSIREGASNFGSNVVKKAKDAGRSIKTQAVRPVNFIKRKIEDRKNYKEAEKTLRTMKISQQEMNTFHNSLGNFGKQQLWEAVQKNRLDCLKLETKNKDKNNLDKEKLNKIIGICTKGQKYNEYNTNIENSWTIEDDFGNFLDSISEIHSSQY